MLTTNKYVLDKYSVVFLPGMLFTLNNADTDTGQRKISEGRLVGARRPPPSHPLPRRCLNNV